MKTFNITSDRHDISCVRKSRDSHVPLARLVTSQQILVKKRASLGSEVVSDHDLQSILRSIRLTFISSYAFVLGKPKNANRTDEDVVVYQKTELMPDE